jgi:hypothetical protein
MRKGFRKLCQFIPGNQPGSCCHRRNGMAQRKPVTQRGFEYKIIHGTATILLGERCDANCLRHTNSMPIPYNFPALATVRPTLLMLVSQGHGTGTAVAQLFQAPPSFSTCPDGPSPRIERLPKCFDSSASMMMMILHQMRHGRQDNHATNHARCTNKTRKQSMLLIAGQFLGRCAPVPWRSWLNRSALVRLIE